MAMSRQDVQNMLDGLEQTVSARINNFLMGEGQPIRDAINAHNAVIIDHEQRMNHIVVQFNATTGETVVEVKRQQEVLAQNQDQASTAPNETQMLDGRLKELTASMATYAEGRDALVSQLQVDNRQLRTDTEYEFSNLKNEIEKWLDPAKAHIDGQGQSGGYGKGSPHGRHTGIDKKEIAVWKFPEDHGRKSME